MMNDETLRSMIILSGSAIVDRAGEIAGCVNGMESLDITISISHDRLPTITWSKEIVVDGDDF